jgi:hypothetical protein
VFTKILGSFKVAIIYTIILFIIYLIIFSVVNNEIKNATINGHFSIKDHRWLLIFQRPFFFSLLCSLNRRSILSEFISFVGTLCGIVASTPRASLSPGRHILHFLPVSFTLAAPVWNGLVRWTRHPTRHSRTPKQAAH